MTAQRLSPVEMLRRLVAFDTTSAKSNLALIEWVRNYLAGHGIDSTLVPNAEGTKANLFATIGPNKDGGIALSGHTDVVPVVGQAWDTDPWKLTEKDGALYGRGSCDMKGFIALALAMAPDFAAAKLRRPVHYCLSYDEEVGCIGVPSLIAKLSKELPRPALAIIGEPTEMQIVNSHKGICGFRTTVTGLEAHSSRIPYAVSAIFHAVDIIGFIQKLAAEYRQAPRLDIFDPPYLTFNVGEISGGTAVNIVAKQCSFVWEFRPIPGIDPDVVLAQVQSFIERDVIPKIKAVYPDGGVVTDTFAKTPAFAPDPHSPAEALARRLTGANRTTTVAFGTEAAVFQQYGIPAIVCGPGNIAQAHQPNEFIALEQVEKGQAFMQKLFDWVTSDEAKTLP